MVTQERPTSAAMIKLMFNKLEANKAIFYILFSNIFNINPVKC